MLGMDLSGSGIDEAAASQGKQQAAGGYEISIEAFEKREQCRRQDCVDDPARADGALESYGGHELVVGQFVPGSNESYGGDDDCIEKNADQSGHPDGLEKSLPAKFGRGFFGGLAYGFESGHEIRDDLQDEQDGNEPRVREEWRQVVKGTLAHPDRDKNDKQGEGAEGCPVLESGAEADAAVVQHGEQRREAETDEQVWEINGAPGDAVDFDGIERRNNVAGDAADGYGLPRADNKVGEHHHPSCGEADRTRESGCGVGNLACGIGHGGHEPAIDPADWEQERTADGEAQYCAKRAAAQKPVVHDHQPADTDHGAPGECEVVGEAKFAG